MANKILLILILLFSPLVAAAPGDIAIISSFYRLSQEEAIDIFSFNSFTFANGEKVKMVVLPRDTFATRSFAYSLGFTSVRFFEKAESAFASGKLNLLLVVESDAEVIRYVVNNYGAIGYVQNHFIVNNSGIPSVIRIR